MYNKEINKDIKNIHEDASWFASYMNAPDGTQDAQGHALVRCQMEKIKQLTEVIENIKGEIELSKNPREFNNDIVLESIDALVNQIKEVSFTDGHFKWIG